MIQLVAFLGNYGREYECTRHNAAWMFADSLPFAQGISWQNKYKADFFAADYGELLAWLSDSGLVKRREDGSLPLPSSAPAKVFFMKPLTYMNLSGDAVGEAARFFKIPNEDVLIVHDEIELAPGFVSLKWGGGLGGHNGLRSVKAVLGTADFWRLRFGVGKCANGSVADYVLGKFSGDEAILMSLVFELTHPLFAKLLTVKDAHTLLGEWGKKRLTQ